MSEQEQEQEQEPVIDPTIDLRSLLAQRVEKKVRRIHRQWFCLDPEVQAELDSATTDLAELVGQEIVIQQGQVKRSTKYAVPTRIRRAEERRNALVEKSRQVGAMAVLQNLTDAQIEVVKNTAGSFEKAVAILTAAFQCWETADGDRIPDEQFGAADFAMLLQPEVLEQGEWLPLASKIMQASTSVIDRPTLPVS